MPAGGKDRSETVEELFEEITDAKELQEEGEIEDDDAKAVVGGIYTRPQVKPDYLEPV